MLFGPQAAANQIHARLGALFPLLQVSGWRYRGFGTQGIGGVPFYILLFDKPIRGRAAFVKLRLSQHSFNDPEFHLADWIAAELHEQEAILIEQRRRQLDCAA
jgi:hypothetical protein